MMKKVGDIINVRFDFNGTKSTVIGELTKIDYKSIMVKTGVITFYEFDINGDVISGEERTHSIDVEDIDIPENPFNYVHSKIENEGFDYFFDGYSDCKDIDHIKFHQLRENYLKAKKELESFVNSEADHEY